MYGHKKQNRKIEKYNNWGIWKVGIWAVLSPTTIPLFHKTKETNNKHTIMYGSNCTHNCKINFASNFHSWYVSSIIFFHNS